MFVGICWCLIGNIGEYCLMVFVGVLFNCICSSIGDIGGKYLIVFVGECWCLLMFVGEYWCLMVLVEEC